MGKEVTVNDANFENEVLKSDIPVFVDFWAPWCGPCKMVGPIIEEISSEYDGKLKICKVNVDDNTDSAAKYEIRSIPTFVRFKDGKEVNRGMGASSKDGLVSVFKEYI